MTIRIVCLERDSTQAVLRKPECRHEWVEYPATAPGETVARLRGAQVAIVNKLRLGAVELEQLPDLRMIALLATGADNIDLRACAAREVVVSNVRGYAVHSVPEHAIALMLALRRRLFDYAAAVREGRWAQSPTFCLLDFPVSDLHGAVLGVVGRGDLGQATARLGAAFGMKVLFAERKGANVVRDGYVEFETVLREADVLSLHCPLDEHTRKLIGAAELEAMKRGAILINTARGGLIDEAALAWALREGVIAGAGVDVLSQEPPREPNPLLAPDIPNLVVTPHMAWASAGAMQALADQVIDNIEAYAAGKPRNRLV